MRQESEAGLLAAIRELAHYRQWRTYHTYRSTRSEPGWVDLVLAKPYHPLWLVELKSPRGRVTVEQAQWLEVLATCTTVHAVLWRPADWPQIERLLLEGRP